jgi:NAD-dependent deacetylase
VAGVKIPYCDQCGGILKPETISFGQAMPEEKMRRAMNHAQECDLCMVLGSSLVVYPAASIPILAVQSGAPLMIVNRDETPLDNEARVLIHDSISRVLQEMLKLAFFS